MNTGFGMTGRFSTVLIALATVQLVACTAADRNTTIEEPGQVPEEARSGFLEDYDRLSPVPGERGVLRWVDPEVDWAQYSGFIVDPIQFRVPPAQQAETQPRPEVVSAATAYLQEALIRELGSRFEIAEEPGAGVARVRAALTAVDPTFREIKTWQLIPVMFVATGVREGAGARGKDLLVFMEGELTDSVNGKLLSETMQGRISREAGPATVAEVNADEIKPVLDFWASELANQIARRQAGNT